MTPLLRVVGVPLPNQGCSRAQYAIYPDTGVMTAAIFDVYGDKVACIESCETHPHLTCFLDCLPEHEQEQVKVWAKAVEAAMKGK